MKHPLTLWVGADIDALNQILNFVYHSDPQSLLEIRFAGETELQSLTLKMWVYYVWKSGYFDTHAQLNLTWLNIDSQLEGSLVPLPDAILNPQQEMELVFEDHRLELLKVWEDQGLEMAYDLLEQSLVHTLEPLDIEGWVFASFKHIESETQLDIPLYRAMHACEIWRYEGLHHWREEFQLPALNAITKGQATAGAHALLSLFKRYVLEPTQITLDPEVLRWQKTHQQVLTIYPATEPLVNYIIFTYNRLSELQNAVNGVIQQTDPRWTLLILDHGSTDATPQYCQEMQRAYPERIKIKRYEVNQGRSAIWRHLQDVINDLTSSWVCFISDDDLVLPHHLSSILNCLETYPWLGYIYGGKNLINDQGQIHQQIGPLYHQDQVVEPGVELQRILKMRSSSPHFVVRKSLLKTVAKWDPYVKGKYEYGMHDTMTHIIALSHTEVACVADVMSHVAFDQSNTFLYNNESEVCEVWFDLASTTVHFYNRLLGNNYPLKPIQNLFHDILDVNLQSLYDALNTQNDPNKMENILELKQDILFQAWQFRQRVYPHCEPTAPYLFEHRPALAPYG